MNKKELLLYEIASSWWACYISWNWVQELAAKYFVWKVERKYNRWLKHNQWKEKVSKGPLDEETDTVFNFIMELSFLTLFLIRLNVK